MNQKPNRDLSATVVRQIRRELAGQGKTFESLARDAGIPLATFYRRMNGKTTFRLSEVDSIAHVLGVPTERLTTPTP